VSTTYEQVMEDVSYALIEIIVGTTITSIAGANPGVTIFTPGSMVGIYTGALLILDTGLNQEVVSVSSTTATTFTATTVFAHIGGAPIVGATFPSGQTDAPLFTQAEIIGYINDAQSDFLRDVRPIYDVDTTAVISTGQRYYAQPPDCIRIERIAINPQPTSYNSITMDLYETSQSSLDLSDPYWQGNQGLPQQWFRDLINNAQYGVTPLPSAGYVAEIWYSQNIVPAGFTLTTLLLVPDVFEYYIKYSVLAKCWSKDGETRDPMRADYCQRRCKLITLLAIKFMTGAGVNMPTGTRGDPDFSPMPITQGAASA
jgi:hypothetical protein